MSRRQQAITAATRLVASGPVTQSRTGWQPARVEPRPDPWAGHDMQKVSWSVDRCERCGITRQEGRVNIPIPCDDFLEHSVALEVLEEREPE